MSEMSDNIKSVKEQYQELLETLKYINNEVKMSFIDSPSNLRYRGLRKDFHDKLSVFLEEHPEVLI